jgi:altronate dehydratase small subunit
VPFGHKICIAEMPSGTEVLKYGQVIGRASRSIKLGEHMHVHNVESARARGDLNQETKQ